MRGQERLIYLWNGSEWVKVIGESVANPNLRARLYAGANPITEGLASAISIDPADFRGLDVRNVMYLWRSAAVLYLLKDALALGDADTGAHTLPVGLWGFNGANWDRLRTYLTGILKVARAETDAVTVRKTAAGAVVAGDHYLYWVACSPDSPGAEWELTDAIAGGGAVVYDHFDPDKHSEHLNFDPPMHFTTGIWIEKFDHMHSLLFCYR